MVKLCYFPYQEREKYKLGDPSTFHYLNQSDCYKIDGLDESKEYLETRKAMDIIGISSEEQVHIWFCNYLLLLFFDHLRPC